MTPQRVFETSELLNCSGPVLVVVAHPDDEVIGLGGHLHLLRNPVIVHTTDGAPRGTSGRSEYAMTRRREVERAVGIAGVMPDRLRTLGEVDQESVYALATMSRLLCEMIAELRPQAIVTHPYEGGHPDHDAAAFAVAFAVAESAAVKASKQWKPAVMEFASYHNGNPTGQASLKAGDFLPGSTQVETIVLGAEDRARKQRMLECFVSQQEMLAQFQVDTERFRYAPAYDFTRAPHEGQLFYEAQNWGVGEEWRRLAAETLRNQ